MKTKYDSKIRAWILPMEDVNKWMSGPIDYRALCEACLSVKEGDKNEQKRKNKPSIMRVRGIL